jgi:parvulin-like peptidyl-prolyl isomerase
MNRRTSRLGPVVASLALAGLCGLGAAAERRPALQLFPDEVLVKGDGIEIRRTQLEDAVAAYKANAAMRGQPIPDANTAEVEARVLDRLLLNEIARRRAADEDKAKAKETAEKNLEEAKRQARSEEGFRRQLLARGLTLEQYQARLLEDATLEQVLAREVKSKIEITPEQVREFYEQGIDPLLREAQAAADKLAKSSPESAAYLEAKRRVEDRKRLNQASLTRPEQARASHVLLYTVDRVTREELPEDVKRAKRELLDKTIARLKAGEDFPTVAREVSEDPDVRQTGGEYTWPRDAAIAPEFKAALFTLPVNQLSDPILTRYGIHVVKVHEFIPPGKPPLDKLQKDIKDYLLNQEVEVRLPAFVADGKKDFAIEIPGAKPAR